MFLNLKKKKNCVKRRYRAARYSTRWRTTATTTSEWDKYASQRQCAAAERCARQRPATVAQQRHTRCRTHPARYTGTSGSNATSTRWCAGSCRHAALVAGGWCVQSAHAPSPAARCCCRPAAAHRHTSSTTRCCVDARFTCRLETVRRAAARRGARRRQLGQRTAAADVVEQTQCI